MPEPGGAPGLAEVVQRWAAQLANTDGVSLPPGELAEILTGVARDAVAKVDAAREAATRRFTALFSAAPVGVAVAGPDGRIVEANAALGRFLDRKPEELRGLEISGLGFERRDEITLADGLEEIEETDADQFTHRVRLAHADDTGVWADVTITGMPGDRPGATYPVLMVSDANEVYDLQEALRRQSVHDSLTGLSNASRFKTFLEGALNPSARDQVALVYLDIDGFKVINDGLGAGYGDRVLRGVARKLESAFTEYEALVARLPGDGFGVLLRGQLKPRDVIKLVEDALADLAEPIYLDGHGVGISASAGIVVRDVADGGPEDLQRAAEIALHRAKEAGKAQWMLFDPELDARDRTRYRLGAEMAGALESGEFSLVYQPTLKLDGSRKLAAVNAGLRWSHRELGELEPAEFYPLADTTGMTMALGKWLLAESLKASARWREQHGDAAPDVCVRLPGRLAIDPDLVRLVKEQLDRHGLPAKALRLCTDSASLLDPRGEVLESLSVLADIGVKLVLTVSGSADLELIPRHELNVQHIVLSGSVVDAIDDIDDEPAVRHLDQLITRARELRLRIGAEGVLTDEQAARLAEHGVIAARGPFIGISVSGDDVDELINGDAGRVRV
ncbi:diguanylate cyclase domain-containing protein [Amycolatopsis sp.]|uniref:diguanylate cyclase domain-containing protein n=1 Tax=Amycolatopsis sp. TaxID=37632 RepID=UPI002BA0DB2F|nr:EAL domain-containing protein [Amycolatopsis sp.]HVV09579.1 EAL domain-containing protein [Amycolatopsis sp.]